MRGTEEANDRLTERIIGAAIEVHKELGPGLLESTYETCLEYELRQRGLKVARQVPIPINYKKVRLKTGYRLDLLVEDKVIVEVKAVDELMPIHQAQLLSYLNLASLRVGLLMNFNERLLKEGIRRLVWGRDNVVQ